MLNVAFGANPPRFALMNIAFGSPRPKHGSVLTATGGFICITIMITMTKGLNICVFVSQ